MYIYRNIDITVFNADWYFQEVVTLYRPQFMCDPQIGMQYIYSGNIILLTWYVFPYEHFLHISDHFMTTFIFIFSYFSTIFLVSFYLLFKYHFWFLPTRNIATNIWQIICTLISYLLILLNIHGASFKEYCYGSMFEKKQVIIV